MTRAAVIIPYYQREAGLLRRALESVAAQAGDFDVTVHLVDDGSPAPAAAELDGFTAPPNLRIDHVRTANRGAPAARNTALDRVSPQADLVAFLDSDDVWAPGHLARAAQALERGFDVYFADHARTEGVTSYFETIGATPLLQGPGVRPLRDDPTLLDLSGADVFGLLLRHYLAQTSATAYRRGLAPELRFEEGLRTAGEDHLFWLHLAQASPRFCASTRIGATCGRGVSIYYSSFDWRGDGNFLRVACLAKLYRRIREAFALTPGDEAFVEEKIRGLTSAMSFFLAHSVLRKGRLPGDLGAVRRQHPGFWRGVARDLPAVTLQLCLGRYRLMEK